MKMIAVMIVSCAVLAGCSGSASNRACEVFSPAAVSVPTTQNSQRVEAQATGEPSDDGKHEQHCP